MSRVIKYNNEALSVIYPGHVRVGSKYPMHVCRFYWYQSVISGQGCLLWYVGVTVLFLLVRTCTCRCDWCSSSVAQARRRCFGRRGEFVFSGEAPMYMYDFVVFADVNECETSEPAPCNNSEYCINSPGSYDCQGTCRSRLVAAG